jgi:hypothetical protein
LGKAKVEESKKGKEKGEKTSGRRANPPRRAKEKGRDEEEKGKCPRQKHSIRNLIHHRETVRRA